MALALLAITPRSPRRIRLSFDHTLASGAYLVDPVTVAAMFQVVSVDSVGVDPAVKASLLVPNSPTVVELVMSDDLIGGGLYEVTCAAVPDTEPATFSGSLRFRPPSPRKAPSAAFEASDLEALLYGVDLVWDGFDLVESPTGDLMTISGIPNVGGALARSLVGDGLPWDERYGAKSRRFIDAPSPSLPEARQNAQRAILADDRVAAVTTKVDLDDNTGKPVIAIQGELVGGHPLTLQHDPSPPK